MLATDDFRALVKLLAPLLRDKGKRDYYLDMAFHAEPAIYEAVSPEADSPEIYAQRLLTFLEREQPRTAAGQSSLSEYVLTVADEVGGDRALEIVALLERIRGTEGGGCAGSPPAEEDCEALIEAYLEGLVKRHAHHLRQAYVALAGDLEQREIDWDSPLGRLLGEPSRSAQRGRRRGRLEEYLPAVEADFRAHDAGSREAVADVTARLLATERAVVLGEPGSGKSWTLARLAVAYADRWAELEPEARRMAPIPVVVPLREFNGLRFEAPTPDGVDAAGHNPARPESGGQAERLVRTRPW